MKLIAIIEDEPAIRDNYAAAFAREGYAVRTYGNRKQAMAACAARLPDLAVIDISLEDEPEGGFELCRALRSMSAELPIIFLTARDSELDAVSGLRLGADDFLTKDLSIPHLIARVNALFRRIEALRKPATGGQTVQRGPLLVDGERMQIQWEGEVVLLSLTEFWIVHALARHPGHVRNRQQLMDAANVVLDDNTITSHVKRIRRKFQALDPKFDAIQTVYGMGYRWGRVTPTMSLRLKLLLLGLFTLVLPFEGYEYARQMEAALRIGEQQSLLAIAQTIAASLQGRADLLYRLTPSSGPALPGPNDLQAVPLLAAPFLDGDADEWPHNSPFRRVFTDGARQLSLLAGVHERMVYLLIEVRDTHVVWDAPGIDVLDPAGFGNRVWVAFTDESGAQHVYLVATSEPGPVHARRIETQELGRQVAVDEARIIGGWQPMDGGYRVELRIPLSMLGARLGVLVDERRRRGGEAVSFGTLDHDSLAPQGRLLIPAPELTNYLTQFVQPGLRLTVIGTDRAVLAQVDALAVATVSSAERGLLPQLYRRLLERRDDRNVVAAQAPITALDRHQGLGTVQIMETSEHSLTLRDKALTQLLDFTIVTSALAISVMFAFAAWLAWRLARLRRASETALTREGLVTTFPDTESKDELGDVARSFSMLLGRLNEYTGYLRTLAGKLAHEIRTPLTIVRSSLDNLESEPVTPAARTYLNRAREGSERLNAILLAMGAATRVEEAIQSAERSRFDLRALIDSAADAYRTGFPERQFAADLPAEPVILSGAPDLIVQMLDKLVDNAVDFSPGHACITLRLVADAGQVTIEVDNPGPTLSDPGVTESSHSYLFESLWQSRSGADSRPHFGLGLYIVRLIAEFHGGSAEAENLPDDAGARFRVRLPRSS